MAKVETAGAGLTERWAVGIQEPIRHRKNLDNVPRPIYPFSHSLCKLWLRLCCSRRGAAVRASAAEKRQGTQRGLV